MQRRCRNVTCAFNLEVQRALMQRALDLAPTARNKVARASRGPRRGSRAGVEVLSDSEARRPWEPHQLNGALKERHSARVQRISISHFQCSRPLTHRSRGLVLRFARTCPWLTASPEALHCATLAPDLARRRRYKMLRRNVSLYFQVDFTALAPGKGRPT